MATEQSEEECKKQSDVWLNAWGELCRGTVSRSDPFCNLNFQETHEYFIRWLARNTTVGPNKSASDLLLDDDGH